MEIGMTSFVLFKVIPLGEGFHFNGNLLETNILNLSVVLAIVISLGGDALRSLLENRKQTIIQNLNQVEERAQEAEEKRNQALAQLERAKERAVAIHKQGIKTSDQEKGQILRQAEDESKQLKEIQQETLRFYQKQAFTQISDQVILLAFQRVVNKLQTSINDRSQTSITNFQIVLFTKYKR